MGRQRRRTEVMPMFAAAVTAYAANCALGAAVAAKVIDTSGFRWLHHVLYIATCVTTATAIGVARRAGPRSASRRAGLALLPAVVPLAAIPYVGTHSRRHPLVALAAAPFLIAGLAFALRPADRK
ncbi:hypothetical protein [Microbacterium aurantiacum]|uniref:hypothetical protein n=1 Tax=Microbacterium aurantiacum TaxID=162393 RepID=UPI001FED0B3C|nr:hypothetical protein [Microbacterium aurantiacum]